MEPNVMQEVMSRHFIVEIFLLASRRACCMLHHLLKACWNSRICNRGKSARERIKDQRAGRTATFFAGTWPKRFTSKKMRWHGGTPTSIKITINLALSFHSHCREVHNKIYIYFVQPCRQLPKEHHCLALWVWPLMRLHSTRNSL